MEHIEAQTTRLLATVEASSMKSSAVHFQPGDILYGRLRPYLNKVHFSEFAGLCSAEFIVLTPYAGIDARFIRSLLNSWPFVSFASGLNAGIDRPRVDFEGITSYELAIPPSAEQRRIVEKIDSLLSKLDAAGAALKRARANLKRYRASVLKAAIEGRLVPTEAELARKEGRDFEPASVLLDLILDERRRRWEESEFARMKAVGKPPKDDRWKSHYKAPPAPATAGLPEIPEGWAYTMMPALMLPSGQGMKTGPFGTLLQKCEHRLDGVPVIGIENIEPLRFVWGSKIHITPEKASDLAGYDLKRGDLIISRSGTVGDVCVVPDNIGAARFSTNVMRIRFLCGAPIPQFIAVLLNGSPFVLSQISKLCRGTTRDFLNQRILSAIALPIPPLYEQHRILQEIDRQLSVARAIEDYLAASETRCGRLRQCILKWAFEGRLVDQDPNDEPASVLLERMRGERGAAAKPVKHRDPIVRETEAAK